MTRLNRALVVYAAALLTASLTAGCNELERTRRSFDDAIAALDKNSADWQVTLKNLEAQLTHDAQSTLRNDVANTLGRAEASMHSNLKCDVDFLRDRVKEELIQLRNQVDAALGGSKPRVVRQVHVCVAIPSDVHMTAATEQRDVVTFDGYNFDSGDIRAEVDDEMPDKTIVHRDASQFLDKPTHYRMTLNLGGNGINLTKRSRRIALEFPGGTSTVGVIQPNPPKCAVRLDSVDFGTHTYRPPKTGGGDAEFWGKMDVDIHTTVGWENNRPVAHLYMKAEQYDDDHTRVEGSDVFDTGYSLPADWEFVDFQTSTDDHLSYRGDKTWEDDYFDRGGGLLRRYVVVGDTGGEEAGTKTQVTAFFNVTRFRIRQVTGCDPDQ